MSYATVDDLKNRMKEFYNELYLDGESVNDDLASEDLAAVSAELDGALGNRYSIPITASSAMPLLRSWALTLCEELAWCRGDAVEVPEAVEKRCAKVRELLVFYADGKRRLSGAAQVVNSESVSLVQAATPVMTRDDLAGW